jgi:hypothetical protein
MPTNPKTRVAQGPEVAEVELAAVGDKPSLFQRSDYPHGVGRSKNASAQALAAVP